MAKGVAATDTFAGTISNLSNRVEALLTRQTFDSCSRVLIALAGVPGSGKSTISNALLDELASRQLQHIAVVPMVCLWSLYQTFLCILINGFAGWISL